MKISFTEHPKELGETYLQHLLEALLFSATLAAAVFVCLIHAFLPFFFTHTGGDMVAKLSDRMTKRTKRKCACATSYKPPKKKRKKNGKSKK
tara:strand:+ start:713 stop:988 length:276 start_codon:yes stop_codon:yes gene_type:complete